MEMGEVIFDRYEIKETMDVSHFPGATRAGLDAYRAVDRTTKEDVMIKVFPIPNDHELASFASALWDREVRITHLATSGSKGRALLRLIDARRDKERSRLVIVSEAGGEPLSSLLKQGRERSTGPFKGYDRAVLWEALLGLTRAVGALHAAGLLHRNICPDTIYVNASESEPLLRLGDFSWTVYLHGLSRMVSEPTGGIAFEGTGPWSEYVAPECYGGATQLGESFESDVFALGLVISDCLVGHIPFTGESRMEYVQKVRRMISDEDALTHEERILVYRMIDTNPSGRPQNMADVSESIGNILSRIGRNLPATPPGPMTVVLDTRPDSKMWKDLKKWIDTDGLGKRLDSFLTQEFKGARVYYNPDRDGQLWILGNFGTPYSLRPYRIKNENRENLAVAAMWPMPFVPIISDEPVLVLGEGVLHTSRGWDESRGASWAPYFMLLKQKKERTATKDACELFVDRLRMTLEAEKELAARDIFAYRTVSPVEQDGKREVLTVELLPDEPNPMFESVGRRSVDSWVRAQFEKGRFDFELSDEPAPTATMDRDRVWHIKQVTEGNRLILDRLEGGEKPSVRGWLKPWEMAYLIPLLSRKRRSVDTARLDNYLLRTLTEPETVTIFPGSREPGDVASDVLGVRPIFLIQGPPGTGKTHWAAQVISKVLVEDETSRILVSAQAHKPLDHLMDEAKERIAGLGLDPPPVLLRLARKEEFEGENVNACEEELTNVTHMILRRASQWATDIPGWKDISREWKDTTAKQLENPSPIWEGIVRSAANVVFVTSTSAAVKDLEDSPPFDLVIIEEAGKAYATELLPPMCLGRRWLLIGDQRQLPPFQHREMFAAARHRLENDESYQNMTEEEKASFTQLLDDELRFFGTMFLRIQNASFPYKPKGWDPPATRLRDQWRMPPTLSEMIAEVFYEDRFTIRTPDRKIPFEKPSALARNHLVWINTPHCKGKERRAEEREAKGGGYSNYFECKIINQLLYDLSPPLEGPAGSLVILSPYLAQIEFLRKFLKKGYKGAPNFDPGRDIHTVDSFQGRQADVVVVSMVRNNDAEQPLGALGFLTEDERMNVLLSRASRQLIIVGSLEHFEMFSDTPEGKKMAAIARYVRAKGALSDARGMIKEW